MILSIDIGNSNTKFGVFNGQATRPEEHLLARFRIRTQEKSCPDEYYIIISQLLQQKNLRLADISLVGISSVVPEATKNISEFCISYGLSYLVIGSKINSPLRITTENPHILGADLLANAVAAYSICRQHCIAIAFGTALTFTCVNSKAEIVGASISAGMDTALESLINNAAQLANINLENVPEPIGRNTTDALRSGFIFGYIGSVEHIVKNLDRALGTKTRVISTGHHVEFLHQYTKSLGQYEPDLTLKGICLLALSNQEI